MSEKPSTRFFTTVTEMRTVPEDKIDHFCEDLRLWLHMHKRVEMAMELLGPETGLALKVLTPTEAFGWIDDDRHDANINVTVNEWLKVPEPPK